MRHFTLSVLVLAFFLFGCIGPSCPQTVDMVCGSDGVTYNNSCLAAAAGADVASAGACEFCTDSDGGKDIFDAGKAEWAGGSMQDSCKDISQVEEAYCSGKSGASEAFPCPAGYACIGGACVNVPCSDTDSGKTPQTKGTIKAGTESYTDECSGPYTLKEYFCQSDQIASEQVGCGAGYECSSGACIESPCKDSDGGKDSSKAGTAGKGSQNSTDSCFDSSSVTEYYCDSNQIKSEKMPCASGYACAGGKCERIVCKDTDGGKNVSAKGTATFGTTSQTDSCYSSTTVLEQYCSSETSVSNEKISCGSGMECFDGSCREIQCFKDEENIDERDVRYKMASFGSDTIRLYKGDALEINSEMILKVNTISGNQSSLRLYMDYESLLDSAPECSLTMTEGDTENDMCGEPTGDIELVTVNAGDNYVELALEDFFISQYYTDEGVIIDWTGGSGCPSDSVEYTAYVAYFLPYMSTSPELDLEGKKFRFLGQLAEIDEVQSDSVRFVVDGDTYTLEDNDLFDYLGQSYRADLQFSDGGLYRLRVDPS